MSLPRNEVATIYGVRDKRDGLYRWIGRTKRSLAYRISLHRTVSDGTLYSWMRAVGDNAEIVHLGSGDAEDERALIKHYWEAGHPLKNKALLHGWTHMKTPRMGVLRNRLCR